MATTSTKTKKKTDELPEKAMRKFINKAVRTLVSCAAYGRKDAVISQFELCDDGRTAKKYARILCDQGYLVPRDKGRSPSYTIGYAWENHVNVEKPDLTATLKASEYRLNSVRNGSTDLDYYGVPLMSEFREGELTIDQVAYILFNPEEFEFGHYGYGKYAEHEWGSDTETRFNHSLVVTNKEYDDFVYELRLGKRITSLYNQNISWALQELCGVSEDDASFMAGEGSLVPRIPRSLDRELKESDWSEIHKDDLTSSENALAYHTRKLEALHRIQLAVAKYGGWDKFQAEYRKRIEDHLRKQDEEENDGDA